MSRNKQESFNNGKSEKSPFLLEETVNLRTPVWEANDELDSKGLSLDDLKMPTDPPVDKWNLVFFVFLLHGLGTLMPWNMFITAKKYFVDFKLDESYTGVQTLYATYFINSIGLATQIPNISFNWLNIFINVGGNLTIRIVCSILIEIVIFVFTVALAMVDSSAWPGTFFWITMVSVVIMNMASGIYQNTIFGMAAALPIKYTGAVILGTNISGVFATIISMSTSAFSSSHRTAAIYYFITAMFVLLICFDTYFALPLNKFYRYYETLNQKEVLKNKNSKKKNEKPYFKIFKKAFPQLFNVFFIFFVTLSVFPAVHSDIKLIEDGSWFPVPNKYFVDITCFLTFNLFAMLGSLTTSWIKWPSPKYLVYPVVLRLLFLPLFFFCNYIPSGIHRSLPVLITSNWAYWLLAIIMAFSSGYLSSLGMMYVPKTVSPKYAVTAGMFGGAMLITGIFVGISFSLVFPILIEHVAW